MQSNRDSARLFFALWPAAHLQARMAALGARVTAQAGGRCVSAASLHLTIAFLGEVALDDIARVRAAATSVRAPRFRLVLDRIGAWRGNGVAWLAPSALPPQAQELSSALREALRAQDVAFDQRRFKPHVTLVRKLQGGVASASVDPLEWSVDEFVLMRSRLDARGAHYACVARWPLT